MAMSRLTGLLGAHGQRFDVRRGDSLTLADLRKGPAILIGAGIPLIDSVGPLLMRKVREGEQVHLEGDRVFVGGHLAGEEGIASGP